MNGSEVPPSRLTLGDLLRVGSYGLRTRRLRGGLSALGIAIGIAAIVAVMGISSSSQARLLNQLDQLGTNLLQVQAGSTFGGGSAELPSVAPLMISRINPVEQVSSVASVSATVLRNRFVDPGQTNGISVDAAQTNLLQPLAGKMAQGVFLNDATGRLPVVVLGANTAARLGIARLTLDTAVWLGGAVYRVAGIMAPLPLAPDLDQAALIGYPMAGQAFGIDGAPTTIYVRADPNYVTQVQGVLGPTANPANPDQVNVSRPSDVLQAKAAAKTTFTSLLLALGAVALFVGGVGIANVMVMSVLERRSEIGLRRALGATRAHIRRQFLTEAVILAIIGGIVGVLLGGIITAAYATSQTEPVVVSAISIAAGIGAALVSGAVAGIYPAIRAARLAPTDALRSA